MALREIRVVSTCGNMLFTLHTIHVFYTTRAHLNRNKEDGDTDINAIEKEGIEKEEQRHRLPLSVSLFSCPPISVR